MGKKPLKIHIFTADDDNSYRQAAVIEGSGLAIYSVDYSDIDGDGRMEIIVGWRVSMDLQALAVYSLEPDGARELMRTNYVKYAVADLNKDGKRELTVLRANQDGEGVADCYVSKKRRADAAVQCSGVHDHGGAEPAGKGHGRRTALQ